MFFFFSSRRRHTRLTCDWSSDVCSSDLTRPATRDGARWPQGCPAHRPPAPTDDAGDGGAPSAAPRGVLFRASPTTGSWLASGSHGVVGPGVGVVNGDVIPKAAQPAVRRGELRP